jgi:hypothetical protein
MRTMLVMVGIAVLGMTFTPLAARAAENDARDTAKYQAAGCALTGGEADVHVEFDAASGDFISQTTCKGGLLDGVTCTNFPEGSICSKPSAPLVDGQWQFYEVVPTWSYHEVIEIFETGSPAEYHQLLTDLEAAGDGGEEAASAADTRDQQQDTNNGKQKKSKHGKKGKNGKKGGKGRK